MDPDSIVNNMPETPESVCDLIWAVITAIEESNGLEFVPIQYRIRLASMLLDNSVELCNPSTVAERVSIY